MTNVKNYLKISSLLYLLFGLFSVLYVPLIISGPFLAIGAILLADSFLDAEELNKKKASLIILAILSILLNFVASILLFIAISEISSVKTNSINSPPENQVSSESKRIDLLLKLGLGMVLVAGILFATTSWEVITDLIKLIALLVLGAVFLGLSKFSESKLKIESTTKAYFILGISFFILTWIGVGYFAPFSEWFSYHGDGSALVFSITFILVAGAFYLVKYKFKDNECAYLGYASSYLSLFALLTFFGLEPMYVLLVMSILSLGINFIPKQEKISSLQEFNRITSFLYWPIIVTESSSSLFVVLVITSLINIFNVIYVSTKSNDNIENLIAAVISYILIFAALLNVPYNIDAMPTIFATMTIFSLLIKYNPLTNNKFLTITSQIIYHVISLVIIFVYLVHPSVETIIITGVYLLANIINSLDLKKTNDQVDFRYQPVVIFFFILSVIGYFDSTIIDISGALVFAICSALYTLISFLTKKETVKDYYFIWTIIASIVTYVINMSIGDIITSAITLLVSIYIHLQVFEKGEFQKIFSYIFILLNIHALCIQLLPSTYGSILTLLILVLLILVIKDKKLDAINYIAIVVPLLTLIESLEYKYYLFKMIAANALALYVLFLILKFFIKDKGIRNLIATIFYPLITCGLLFAGEISYGLYIGILAVIILFITFNEDEYKTIFYAAIVITIVNIIVQLWEFWVEAPLWLYLLIVGISIIAFVTYKEIKKKDEPLKPIPTEPKHLEMSNDELLKSMSTFPTENTQTTVQNNNCQDPECQHQHTPQPVTAESEKQEFPQPQTLEEDVKVGNFCPTCGTPNKGGRFCALCGRNLIIKK